MGSFTVILLSALLVQFGNISCEKEKSPLRKNGFCRKDKPFEQNGKCYCYKGMLPDCEKAGCPDTKPTEPMQRPVCPIPTCSKRTTCPKDDRPVCGVKVEFKNFGNLCVLGSVGCSENFRFFGHGTCLVNDKSYLPLNRDPRSIPPPTTTETDDNGDGFLDESGICIKDGSYHEGCKKCVCEKQAKPSCSSANCHSNKSKIKEEACIMPNCGSGTCTKEYRPVCGIRIKLKTFSNVCELGSEGCREGYRFHQYNSCHALENECQK